MRFIDFSQILEEKPYVYLEWEICAGWLHVIDGAVKLLNRFWPYVFNSECREGGYEEGEQSKNNGAGFFSSGLFRVVVGRYNGKNI